MNPSYSSHTGYKVKVPPGCKPLSHLATLTPIHLVSNPAYSLSISLNLSPPLLPHCCKRIWPFEPLAGLQQPPPNVSPPPPAIFLLIDVLHTATQRRKRRLLVILALSYHISHHLHVSSTEELIPETEF